MPWLYAILKATDTFCKIGETRHESVFTVLTLGEVGGSTLLHSSGLCPTILSQKAAQESGQSHAPSHPQKRPAKKTFWMGSKTTPYVQKDMYNIYRVMY